MIHSSGESVTIFSNTLPDATEVQTRKNWTESYVKFSPLGSYLATCHGKENNGSWDWNFNERKEISKSLFVLNLCLNEYLHLPRKFAVYYNSHGRILAKEELEGSTAVPKRVNLLDFTGKIIVY